MRRWIAVSLFVSVCFSFGWMSACWHDTVRTGNTLKNPAYPGSEGIDERREPTKEDRIALILYALGRVGLTLMGTWGVIALVEKETKR